MQTFRQYLEEQKKIDQIQAALDIAGFEPTVGTAADAANTVISGLRAALAKEPDERKQHIINAGISAISLIPFADVIKVLKLRKLGRPATKLAIQGARSAQQFGKTQQKTDRFQTKVEEKKDYCYRKAKKKFKGDFPSLYAGAYMAKCRKKNK